MISVYSNVIEQKSFGHLFKKMQPPSGWCEVSKVSRSVICTDNLAQAEKDSHAICRARLNSYVRKWGKECDTESKKQNLKDERGVVTPTVFPSKIPLGEFAESSFRTKSTVFNPCSPMRDNLEPGAHIVMAVFGVLIYEMNQCAATMTPTNVSTCFDQLQVCKSYAGVKGDFSSVLSGLPTKLIEIVADKTKKSTLEGKTTKEDYETIYASINDMGAIDKLVTQVVKLVTAAKTSPSATSSPCALLWTSMGEFDWAKLENGTLKNELSRSPRQFILVLDTSL